MSDTFKLTERLDILETRIAFQDQTIDELNATITEQWQIIDTLTRKVALLEDHVRTAAGNIADPRHEPPPPHY